MQSLPSASGHCPGNQSGHNGLTQGSLFLPRFKQAYEFRFQRDKIPLRLNVGYWHGYRHEGVRRERSVTCCRSGRCGINFCKPRFSCKVIAEISGQCFVCHGLTRKHSVVADASIMFWFSKCNSFLPSHDVAENEISSFDFVELLPSELCAGNCSPSECALEEAANA